MEAIIPYVALAAGVGVITAAALDANWLLESRKAKIWLKMFGRNGARVVYGLIGVFLIVLGVIMLIKGPGGDVPAS